MKRIVLVYGSIAGVIVGGLMFATWPLGVNGTISMEYGMLVGYAIMIIALSQIFFAVKSYRNKHLNGAIGFGKAFLIGLLITGVASLFYASSWELAIRTVAKDFPQKFADHYVEKKMKEGANEEAIASAKQEMAEFKEMYKNPVIRFGLTITEILPVGILISLLSATLLRKKEFLPATE